jgi:predicted RNA-binding protein YlxR (DUF448 family)
VRIVRTTAGSVVVDPTGKLAGRGAYVHDDAACRGATTAPGALSKALRTPFPPELRAALTGTPNTNIIEEEMSGTK